VERGLPLIEVELGSIELRPQGPGFGRERRRRSRRCGLVAGVGLSGLIRLLGLALSEDLRSLGKSGRRQRAGGCDQHKRATGENERSTEAFEETRHHADLFYPNLLSIESGPAMLFWSDHAQQPGTGPNRAQGVKGAIPNEAP